MKFEFLEDLRDLLEDNGLVDAEIESILTEYSFIFDEMQKLNLSYDEIIERIGSPKQIVKKYKDKRFNKKNAIKNNKWVALTPFISVIGFFVLGNLGYWNFSWMFFLLIPLVIMWNQSSSNKVIILSAPLIAGLAFFSIGFGTQTWHPTWLVFLWIPASNIIFSKMKPLRKFSAISPLIAIVSFILIGVYTNLWNPAWLVFLLIPMTAVLHKKSMKRIIFYELSFVVAISIYLFMGWQYGLWGIGLLAFILPIAYSVLIDDLSFHFGFDFINNRYLARRLSFVLIILATVIYVVIGTIYNDFWRYGWMIYLLIPIITISVKKSSKFSFSAISPFVATIVFFSLGFFADLWSISWLAFLMIPMSAIIENK